MSECVCVSARLGLIVLGFRALRLQGLRLEPVVRLLVKKPLLRGLMYSATRILHPPFHVDVFRNRLVCRCGGSVCLGLSVGPLSGILRNWNSGYSFVFGDTTAQKAQKIPKATSGCNKPAMENPLARAGFLKR